MAGGVWLLRRVGGFHRQSGTVGPMAFQFGTRPPARPGEPDFGRGFGNAPPARRCSAGDIYAAPILADRVLLVGGRINPFLRGVARTFGSGRSRLRHAPVGEMTENVPGRCARTAGLSDAVDKEGRGGVGQRRLHRGAAHAGFDADLRHARRRRRSIATRSSAWAALGVPVLELGAERGPVPPARRPTRAASVSRRRCRTSATAAKSNAS